MIKGTIVDMAIGIYSTTDVIIFHKILSGKQLYLEVIYTINDIETFPYYFKWKEIPKEIYSIYLHAKVHTDIKFDNSSGVTTVSGIHLLRNSERKYVLAKFPLNECPIMKVLIEFTDVSNFLSDLDDEHAKFYTVLATKIQNVSK
jgi:hypothetical protein